MFRPAFKIYCQYGYSDEARRLESALSGGTDAEPINVPQLTAALWHVQEGKYKEADLILRSMENPASRPMGDPV